jgi:hypothetical protein
MKPKNKFRKSNRMLLDERPLVLLPSLAKAVGATGAIALQQLHFHLANPNNGRIHEGEQWIFKTYEDWHKDDFPFWSTDQIQRIFSALEKKELIVSDQPEGRNTRRKYYRINYGALEKAMSSAPSRTRTRTGSREIASSSYSETTRAEKGKGVVVVSHKSSEDDSNTVFVPKVRYPESEEEMHDTLERLGIEPNPDYDGNFFAQMQASGWTIHGEPVWDWPATYQARLEVTQP